MEKSIAKTIFLSYYIPFFSKKKRKNGLALRSTTKQQCYIIHYIRASFLLFFQEKWHENRVKRTVRHHCEFFRRMNSMRSRRRGQLQNTQQNSSHMEIKKLEFFFFFFSMSNFEKKVKQPKQPFLYRRNFEIVPYFLWTKFGK